MSLLSNDIENISDQITEQYVQIGKHYLINIHSYYDAKDIHNIIFPISIDSIYNLIGKEFTPYPLLISHRIHKNKIKVIDGISTIISKIPIYILNESKEDIQSYIYNILSKCYKKKYLIDNELEIMVHPIINKNIRRYDIAVLLNKVTHYKIQLNHI